MQVTLDLINWSELIQHPSAEDYIDWVFNLEDEGKSIALSCYKYGWESDSAIQYFELAEAFEYALQFLDSDTKEIIQKGLLKLISYEHRVDEFMMAPASDDCYWISASPKTTKEILKFFKNTDFNKIKQALIENPNSEFESLLNDFDSSVIPFVKQHIKILEAAASKEFGIMGPAFFKIVVA
jgi:hypothetical protein